MNDKAPRGLINLNTNKILNLMSLSLTKHVVTEENVNQTLDFFPLSLKLRNSENRWHNTKDFILNTG